MIPLRSVQRAPRIVRDHIAVVFFPKRSVCGVVKQFVCKQNIRCSPEVHVVVTFYMFIRARPNFRARKCILPPSRMTK